MMAATHRLGGLAGGMFIIKVAELGNREPVLQAVIISAAVLGSLIPDIDNMNSSISKKWKAVSLIVYLIQAVVRMISSLLPTRMEKHMRSVVGHRGITHSLLMCIIIGGFLFSLRFTPIISNFNEIFQRGYLSFTIGIIVGILSHLIFDMFSGGVPLFSPFINKRIAILNIKTGGIIEWVIRIVIIILFTTLLVEKVQRFI